MSVPRTDDRHREKTDRRRRPLHQPVSGPDRDPLLPGLATPGLSCAEAARFQAFRKTAGETRPYLAVGEGLAPPAPAGVVHSGAIVELIETGLEAREQERKNLFELADRLDQVSRR